MIWSGMTALIAFVRCAAHVVSAKAGAAHSVMLVMVQFDCYFKECMQTMYLQRAW